MSTAYKHILHMLYPSIPHVAFTAAYSPRIKNSPSGEFLIRGERYVYLNTYIGEIVSVSVASATPSDAFGSIVISPFTWIPSPS